MNSEIKTAFKKYQAAAKQLSEKLEKTYPPGYVVCITTRTNSGLREHRIRVLDDFWWDEPGYITGINIKTGKRLTFNVGKVESIEGVEDEE